MGITFITHSHFFIAALRVSICVVSDSIFEGPVLEPSAPAWQAANSVQDSVFRSMGFGHKQ